MNITKMLECENVTIIIFKIKFPLSTRVSAFISLALVVVLVLHTIIIRYQILTGLNCILHKLTY